MARKDTPSKQTAAAPRPVAKPASAPKKRPVAAPATSLPPVAATINESSVFAASAAADKEPKPMEDTVKKTTAQAQTLFADFNDRAKAAEAAGADLGAKPICSGSYKFVERGAPDSIVLERFAGYWNADAYHFDKEIGSAQVGTPVTKAHR